jgi:small-conductance mechanosensitive channel
MNKFIISFMWTTIGVVVTLLATSIGARYARKGTARLISWYTQKDDISQYSFFQYLVSGIVYFIGIFAAISMIPALQNIAYSMLASSGILALIAGFASQQVFSNIVSGFFIEIFSPFKVGDTIKVAQNTQGQVKEITLRHTVIETDENKTILIPNATINASVIERIH